MTRQTTTLISKYIPCRSTEHYLDYDGEIEVASGTGVALFRLKGLGRAIWLLSDGGHTICEITTQLCKQLGVDNKTAVQKELITILSALVKKSAIVANWNPLHK